MANTPLDAARLPRFAALTPGRGKQARLLIDAPAASAEIYLHGATLTSYRPHGAGRAGEHDMFFTSSEAIFDAATTIRGGVPLCSPWFGVGISGKEVPKHGWTANVPWQLRSVEGDAHSVRALFELEHEDLHYLYEVTAGSELELLLSVRNAGSEARQIEAAFHHYFAVGDLTAVSVTGLEGESFEDYVHGGTGTQHGALGIDGPIDRIYTCSRPLSIEDPAWGRRITIEGLGASHAIVWNPWAQAARGMADLADSEWPSFLCVESGLIRTHAPILEPGQSASVGVRLGLETL